MNAGFSVLSVVCATDRLVLDENMLQGTIPASIGNCTKLTDIQIQGNQFTGTVPSTIGQLTSLGRYPHFVVSAKVCSLVYCKVSSPINHFHFLPRSQTSTEIFKLHQNKIGGAMPQEVCDLRDHTLGNVLQTMIVTCSQTQSYMVLDDNEAVDCAVPDCCSTCFS
jgi:hypothetical protein